MESAGGQNESHAIVTSEGRKTAVCSLATGAGRQVARLPLCAVMRQVQVVLSPEAPLSGPSCLVAATVSRVFKLNLSVAKRFCPSPLCVSPCLRWILWLPCGFLFHSLVILRHLARICLICYSVSDVPFSAFPLRPICISLNCKWSPGSSDPGQLFLVFIFVFILVELRSSRGVAEREGKRELS